MQDVAKEQYEEEKGRKIMSDSVTITDAYASYRYNIAPQRSPRCSSSIQKVCFLTDVVETAHAKSFIARLALVGSSRSCCCPGACYYMQPLRDQNLLFIASVDVPVFAVATLQLLAIMYQQLKWQQRRGTTT